LGNARSLFGRLACSYHAFPGSLSLLKSAGYPDLAVKVEL